MHLPFSSILPSYAVSDARGAFGLRDYDGTIAVAIAEPRMRGSPAPTSKRCHDLETKRRVASVHDFDRSLTINTGPHRPRHAGTATRLLGTPSGTETALPLDGWASRGVRTPQPSRWGTNAFTGSVGHLHDGLRTNFPRATLIEHGCTASLHGSHREAGYHHTTRHPMSPNGLVTPGPGAYDLEQHMPKMFSQLKNFDRSIANDVYHQRKATIIRPGNTPNATTAVRLVDTTSPGQANIHDATPGPGSYPQSEFSQFAPRPRSVSYVTSPSARLSTVSARPPPTSAGGRIFRFAHADTDGPLRAR